MHIASSTESLTTSDGGMPGWPARLDVVGEPACIIQIRLTKQIRRNKRKIKASSRGQGRQEFALYRRARGYGRNTSCKRRLAAVGEPACIIQIRLTKQIRRNKRKIKASSRGQGRQEFALYRRARGYGRNTSCKRRLAVPAFAREACAKRGKILAANIPPRCCCLCEGSLRQARGNTCCKHPA